MKSRMVWYAGLAASMAVVAVAMMWRPAIPAAASPHIARDPQTLAGGALVVAQGDCIVCHTAAGAVCARYERHGDLLLTRRVRRRRRLQRRSARPFMRVHSRGTFSKSYFKHQSPVCYIHLSEC